jgi:hypothetical protein
MKYGFNYHPLGENRSIFIWSCKIWLAGVLTYINPSAMDEGSTIWGFLVSDEKEHDRKMGKQEQTGTTKENVALLKDKYLSIKVVSEARITSQDLAKLYLTWVLTVLSIVTNSSNDLLSTSGLYKRR